MINKENENILNFPEKNVVKKPYLDNRLILNIPDKAQNVSV